MMSLNNEFHSEIPCLLLPIAGCFYLIPCSCVHHIISLRQNKTALCYSNEKLSFVKWNKQMIPFLSIGTEDQSVSRFAKLAFIHGVPSEQDAPLPLYAVLIEGLPKVVVVKSNEIRYTGELNQQAPFWPVLMHGVKAYILNLLELEQFCLINPNRPKAPGR